MIFTIFEALLSFPRQRLRGIACWKPCVGRWGLTKMAGDCLLSCVRGHLIQVRKVNNLPSTIDVYGPPKAGVQAPEFPQSCHRPVTCHLMISCCCTATVAVLHIPEYQNKLSDYVVHIFCPLSAMATPTLCCTRRHRGATAMLLESRPDRL